MNLNVTLVNLNFTLMSLNFTLVSLNFTLVSLNFTLVNPNVALVSLNVTLANPNVTLANLNFTRTSLNFTLVSLNFTLVNLNFTSFDLNLRFVHLSVTLARAMWQNPLPGVRMNTDEREDNTIYKVVVNGEEQYSIWPADREIPLGWNDAGKSGTKAECLAYIQEVWTDMRPLSLRKKMQEMGYP